MRRSNSYRDLIAWQKARILVQMVYATTAGWPESERFGLTAQIRRAAVSVPSNIAEGSGRSGSREFRRGLSLAHGSLCELETQLLLGIDLGWCEPQAGAIVLEQAAEVGRIIRGLIQTLDHGMASGENH
ncbi:MAG: four helix bundle protein [Thermomicrobiales bacterium]